MQRPKYSKDEIAAYQLPENESKIKRGRKRKGHPLAQVNETTVFSLASHGLNQATIARMVGISITTLRNRKELLLAYYKGRGECEKNVRMKNHEEAMNGNDKALERELKMLGLMEPERNEINIHLSEVKEKSDDEILDALEGEFEKVDGSTDDTR